MSIDDSYFGIHKGGDQAAEPREQKDNVVYLSREMHSGQLRVAERFVSTYADRLLHIHGIGWHRWSGTHWIEDRDGQARRLLVALLKDLRHESVELEKAERDRLLGDVRRCESATGMSGVLDIAKYLNPMTTAAEEVNGQPDLFNTPAGTLDLTTGEMHPHDPRDLITKCSGVGLVPGAHSALFDNFLETVLPDAEVRSYLQRVFGVAMLGSVREHQLPIITGVGGNGKSVCLDVVLAAFGDYGLTVDPQLIMKTRHERHGTFIADLHGARLVVTSETDEGDVLAASTVKRLTGGDKLRANRMRQDPFEFTPSHSLIYCTNHQPRVDASDRAMWRRISVIPFDVTIAEPDVALPEKLRGELSGVLAWVFEGWRDYQRQGLNPPEAVTKRTEAYRSDSDPISQFLTEECVASNGHKVKATYLFEAWARWALAQGHPPMSQTDFGRRMADRGFERKRSAAGNQYIGLGLLSRDDEQGDELWP